MRGLDVIELICEVRLNPESARGAPTSFHGKRTIKEPQELSVHIKKTKTIAKTYAI